MVEKKPNLSSAVDMSIIRPDGPIKDEVDHLSRYLEVDDLARIEIEQLKRQAAELEVRLHMINMAREMLEKKYL